MSTRRLSPVVPGPPVSDLGGLGSISHLHGSLENKDSTTSEQRRPSQKGPHIPPKETLKHVAITVNHTPEVQAS